MRSAPLPPSVDRGGRGAQAVARPAGAAVSRNPQPGPTSVLRGVRWSLSYAAMLLYVITITTYQIRFGDVIMAAALVGLVMEGRIRMPPALAAFGVLTIMAFLSQFGSLWPGIVSDEAVNIGKVWLVAFVAACTLTDAKRIRLFMIVFLGAYALYPVRGALVNYFVVGYSLDGRALWNFIYANPNDLAALTLLQLSMAAAIFVAEPRGWFRRAAAVGLVVLPVLILLTQSRGVFLGLLLFGVLAGAGQRKRLRLVGYAALLAVTAVLVVPESAWDRLGMVGTIGSGGTETLGTLEDDGSAEQRYEIWKTARQVVRDHPIGGTGWGTYPLANAAYAPALGARDAHSTYLSVAAELGIPGLIVFLAIMGLVMVRGYNVRRQVGPVRARQITMLILGLICYLVAGIFGSYARLTFLYLHVILIWAVTEIALKESRRSRRASLALRGARCAA